MRKEQVGKLITHDIKIELHEMETILYFLKRGYDIELIVPSNTPRNTNADFMMEQKIWESKCPLGKSLVTLEKLFRKAGRQSENVVFDLRKFGGDEKRARDLLTKLFQKSRKIRHMYIILKTEKLLKFP